jgi:hypothetical protein
MKTKSIITTIELTHEELLTALRTVIPDLSVKAKIEDYEKGITFSIKVEDETIGEYFSRVLHDKFNAEFDIESSAKKTTLYFDTESYLGKNLVKSKPHNPMGLSKNKIGTRYGYRLLDVDEILDEDKIRLPLIYELQQFVNSSAGGWTWNNKGSNKHVAYRTKLTREELKKARGL